MNAEFSKVFERQQWAYDLCRQQLERKRWSDEDYKYWWDPNQGFWAWMRRQEEEQHRKSLENAKQADDGWLNKERAFSRLLFLVNEASALSDIEVVNNICIWGNCNHMAACHASFPFETDVIGSRCLTHAVTPTFAAYGFGEDFLRIRVYHYNVNTPHGFAHWDTGRADIRVA